MQQKTVYTTIIIVIAILLAGGLVFGILQAKNRNANTNENSDVIETIRRIAYIKEVREESGKIFFDLDYVDFFTGEEARQAAFEDGECAPLATCALNGIYVRNDDDSIFPVQVREEASIVLASDFAYDASGIREITVSDFQMLYMSQDSVLPSVTFEVTMIGGMITALAEKFIP